MRAVEQHDAVSVAACRIAKSRHEWILAAGNGHSRKDSTVVRLADQGRNAMKERLIKKFEDEIQALNHELKLELPKEIKRARELGDLRENAEYQAAKERQRLVESRISMLQKRVGEIAMINVDRIPRDRAGFGSTLHVVEATGEKMTFQLVMPEDADAEKGLISTTSPIGRALINKEPGDSVKVTTPGGMREFEIVKLFTIHDEA
jgi:transcription elongation factor GreA